MSAEVEIRPATAADEPALTRIDRATHTPQSTIAPPPGPGHSVFDDRTRSESTLVAVIDGEPAGFVALRPPTPHPSNSHVLEICGLAVDPEHQRGGVGRALIEAATRDAAGRGARRLTLRVLSSNAGARRLYESCGFSLEGVLREEFLLAGEYVDDVLMARRL